LKSLAFIIQNDSGDDIRNDEIRDSAISAFGKILFYQESDQENLISMWQSWLPLSSEPLDAYECHSLFLDFAEQNNPNFWGEYYKNLPKILEIFSFCLAEHSSNYVRYDTITRIYNLLTNMKNNDPELLNQAMQTLSQSDQEILNKSLST